MLMTEQRKRLTFYTVVLAGTLIFSLVTAYQIFKTPYEAGILFRSRRWMAGLGLAGLIVIAELAAVDQPDRLAICHRTSF